MLCALRSFYVADRKFYAADVAARLYQPSAYYIANAAAGRALRSGLYAAQRAPLQQPAQLHRQLRSP